MESNTIPSLDAARMNKITMGLVELRVVCHLMSRAKSFWDNPRTVDSMLMYIIRELTEASEWNKLGNPDSARLKTYSALEEELADAVIRIFDMAGGMDLDIASAIVAKLNYNQNREFAVDKNL